VMQQYLNRNRDDLGRFHVVRTAPGLAHPTLDAAFPNAQTTIPN
jgi:hypothetical protein